MENEEHLTSHIQDGRLTNNNGDHKLSKPSGRLPPIELEVTKTSKRKSKSLRLQTKPEITEKDLAVDNETDKDSGRGSVIPPDKVESSVIPPDKVESSGILPDKSTVESRRQKLSIDVKSSRKASELSTGQLPVNASSTSLQTFENQGLDEECETIEVISSQPASAHFTKAQSPSILKYSSDHITSMFQAGSRPSSAGSSKHTVRIADEVTYSTDNLRAARSKKSRPQSAKSIQAANGHVTVNGRSNASVFKLKQTTQVKISPHFKTSIFTLVLCGVFAGAGALYFSLLTKKSLKEGE